MAQEFTPAPEEFSPPPETAALPEEFPALGTREEPHEIPARCGTHAADRRMEPRP